MRLALIQTGGELPPFDTQLAALSLLHADDYAVVRLSNTNDWRLFHDRLELLVQDDCLCVASLETFALCPKELMKLLTQLIARGVSITVAAFFDSPLTLSTPQNLTILTEHTALAERLELVSRPLKNRAPRWAPNLLTYDEIQEIRHLYKRGMSPQRLSQALRRSPLCISALVCGAHRPSEVSFTYGLAGTVNNMLQN